MQSNKAPYEFFVITLLVALHETILSHARPWLAPHLSQA